MVLALSIGCDSQPKELQPLQQMEGVVLDPTSISPPLSVEGNGNGEFAIEDANGDVRRFYTFGTITVKTGQKIRVNYRESRSKFHAESVIAIKSD